MPPVAEMIEMPKTAVEDIVQLSEAFREQMHRLLELNAEGRLGPGEQAELSSLVRLAEVEQIATMALMLAEKHG